MAAAKSSDAAESKPTEGLHDAAPRTTIIEKDAYPERPDAYTEEQRAHLVEAGLLDGPREEAK